MISSTLVCHYFAIFALCRAVKAQLWSLFDSDRVFGIKRKKNATTIKKMKEDEGKNENCKTNDGR